MLQTLTAADQAVESLAQSFNTQIDTESVLRAAFDWYYVPLAPDRQAYRDRVIAQVLTRVDHKDDTTFPDWFWRVHQIRILGRPIGEGSVPPPPDPK